MLKIINIFAKWALTWAPTSTTNLMTPRMTSKLIIQSSFKIASQVWAGCIPPVESPTTISHRSAGIALWEFMKFPKHQLFRNAVLFWKCLSYVVAGLQITQRFLLVVWMELSRQSTLPIWVSPKLGNKRLGFQVCIWCPIKIFLSQPPTRTTFNSGNLVLPILCSMLMLETRCLRLISRIIYWLLEPPIRN